MNPAPPIRLAAATVLVAALFSAPDARAAEGYDNCNNFITTLPTVITTQGVWCMNHDLATAITTGDAILVGANNVTLDCNAFKLGNLAAGTGTQAIGIHAISRSNVRVRGCSLRGFRTGIAISGSGGGHMIESNRIEGATVQGLYLQGDNGLVRNNQFFDIGGSTEAANIDAFGIVAVGAVEIIGNSIAVVESVGLGDAMGMFLVDGFGSTVRDNVVRGVAAPELGLEFGIGAYGTHVSIRGNDLTGHHQPGSIGVYCASGPVPVRDNTIGEFSIGVGVNCGVEADNMVYASD